MAEERGDEDGDLMTTSRADRTILLTGGAGDVGRATAARFDAAGATVVLVDRDPDRLADARRQLPRTRTLAVDLSVDSEIRGLAARVGPEVDTVVHAAGISRVERFVDSDPATWDDLYRINQRAPMLLSRLLLPHLVDRGFGRLVFVSSEGARAGAGGEAVYAATKAALLGFAKSIAREHARDGITANIVCPGPIDGAMVSANTADDPRLVERFTRLIPLRRFADPDEVARAIVWFADPGNSYLTGQTLSVSGGITMS